MVRRRQSLEHWIVEACTDTDKEGQITALALVHVVNQVEDKEVHAIRFGSKKWKSEDLADLFQRKAESFSQDLSGVQQFALLAFYGKRKEPEARHGIRVTGSLDLGNGSSEPPTKDGMTTQGMRHLEIAMQMALRQTATVMEASNEQMKLLLEANTLLLRENQDSFAIVKELLFERANNDHAHRMTEAEYERSTAERKKWLSFAPPLINTILGREVFPQETADSALVESIADALGEEDIKKLSTILPPQLWGPLADRLTGILKTKREATESAMVVSRSGDPADDAAGD